MWNYKKNIDKTHLEQKVKLYNVDFLKAINEIKNEQIDIIYLDPPYKTNYIKSAICELIKNKSLTQDTLIIAETDEEEKILTQIEEIDEIEIIDKRKYGRANILFLKKISRKEE